jgi:hypothetical protein
MGHAVEKRIEDDLPVGHGDQFTIEDGGFAT